MSLKINRINEGKRGQITLFIIIGIVILVSFGLTFTLVSQSQSRQLQAQQEEVIHRVLESSTVAGYVGICVDDALEQGLVTLGEQGGNLFGGQFGARALPPKVTLNQKNISALISDDQVALPPLYPCSFDFLEKPPAYCRFPQNGLVWRFGSSHLQPLEGSGVNTVGAQLERFIEGYVGGCVNVTDLAGPNALPGYNITKGTPSAKVSFSENAVRVNVDFPLSVQVADVRPVSQFVKFAAQKDVRFKRLYQAVEDMVNKELIFSDFNLETDPLDTTFTSKLTNETSFSRFRPLRTEVVFTPLRLGFDDIFILNDTKSNLRNQSFVFRFARQNRPPALFYVNRYHSLHDIYDLLVIENESATLALEAVDPDEDNFTFHYAEGSSLSGVVSLRERNLLGLVPSSSSVGYHNLTVSVTDGQKSDWQEVRVLVDKRLRGEFITDNNYADVEDRYASIEDPVFVNLTSPARSLDPFAEYDSLINYVSLDDFGNPLEGDSEPLISDCIAIPGFQPCENATFNITAISSQLFTKTTGSRPGIITLNTNVRYNGFSQSVDASSFIDVKQCLPHRNLAHPYPYPYHELLATGGSEAIDPFQANHACCSADFTVAPASTVCFENSTIQCSQSYKGGYVAQGRIQRRFCDGQRGNVCLGVQSTDTQLINVCGTPLDGPSCRAPTQCQGIEPFGRRALGNNEFLWCYGDTWGCEDVCTTEIVDENQDTVFGQGDSCGCGLKESFVETRCLNLKNGQEGTCSLLGACTG